VRGNPRTFGPFKTRQKVFNPSIDTRGCIEHAFNNPSAGGEKTNPTKHPMNKVELVAHVQKSLGAASKAEAERAVNAVINGIKAGLKKSKSVQLIGFGTLKVGSRKARSGVNPKTGEKIRIKASKTVRFVAGKALKQSI
jgi:DNA-binding protein HU-beta